METFILQIIVLAISVAVTTCCAPGWKKNSGLSGWCFLFSHNQVTWAEAEEICRSFEGYLAEPTNKPIDDYLITETLKTGRKYWLGLSDLEQEGTFLWTTSQTPITSYKNWIPGTRIMPIVGRIVFLITGTVMANGQMEIANGRSIIFVRQKILTGALSDDMTNMDNNKQTTGILRLSDNFNID